MAIEESRVTQMWFEHYAKKPVEIAELLHRSRSTITRHRFKLVVKRSKAASQLCQKRRRTNW